jgi:hypothetical protein
LIDLKDNFDEDAGDGDSEKADTVMLNVPGGRRRQRMEANDDEERKMILQEFSSMMEESASAEKVTSFLLVKDILCYKLKEVFCWIKFLHIFSV